MGVTMTVEVVLPEKEMIEPAFNCACGTRAASRKCSVGMHKGRWFYRCSNGWVDNSTTEEDDPLLKRVRSKVSSCISYLLETRCTDSSNYNCTSLFFAASHVRCVGLARCHHSLRRRSFRNQWDEWRTVAGKDLSSSKFKLKYIFSTTL
jgi:hypothetical protein